MIEYIERLLQGAEVQWKTLGEVAELKRGTSVTKKTSTPGNYPVISGGQKPAYYIDTYNREGETITIAGSGVYAGFVQYWNEQIFVADAFSIKVDEHLLLTRFVYYFLLTIQDKIYNLKSVGGIPHVYSKDVACFTIPIPPLEVQREIVRILDKFTELEAELEEKLEAELECRRKQYGFYRDKLLSEEYLLARGKVEWRMLGEVGEFVRGSGLQKSDLTTEGVPAIHYGQIYTYYGTYTEKTKSYVSEIFATKKRKASYGDLIIATTSENDEDVCKAVAWLGKSEVVVSSDACFYHHCMVPKYISYFFQTDIFQLQKRNYITGTKVRRVNANDLAKIKIPIPPLSVQEEVVRILDKFDTLTTSISEGLPREIELRRKQYEYYRERLLSFDNDNA